MDGVTTTEVFACPTGSFPLTEQFLAEKMRVDISGVVNYCIDAPQTDTMTSFINGVSVEHTSELLIQIPADHAANVTQFCADVMLHIQDVNPQQCESMFKWLDTINTAGGETEVLTSGISRIPVTVTEMGANVLLDHGPYPGIFNSQAPDGIGDFLQIPIQDFIRVFEQFVTTLQDARARDVLFEAITTPISPAAAQYSAEAARVGLTGWAIAAIGIAALSVGIPFVIQAINEKASEAWKSRGG